MNIKDKLQDLPVIGTALTVQRRTKADAADQFGAAIAFFGFVSLIPLIAVGAGVAGFFFADRPDLVTDLVDGVQQAVPGLQGDTIDESLRSAAASIVDARGSALVIGVVTALFAGLRVANAAQTATQFVFGVALDEVKALKARLWQLASLAVLGTLALAGVAASSWMTAQIPSGGGLVGTLQAAGVSALFDVPLFWVAYRMYSTGSEMTWRKLLPGALFGGIGWALLKTFGGAYLTRVAEGSPAAGVVATLIGLLTVFYLAGRLYVYGAELAAVLAGHGEPAASDADDADADEVDDDIDDATTRGDRAGLLAALEAHERSRGVDSPDTTADADTARAALFERHAGGDDTGGGVSADGMQARSDDDATGAEHDEDTSDSLGVTAPDQDVVADGSAAGDVDAAARPSEAAGAPIQFPTHGASGADAAAQPAGERGGTSSSGVDPEGSKALVAYVEDASALHVSPTTKRVAAGAVAGLVGVAIGVWRRRQQH